MALSGKITTSAWKSSNGYDWKVALVWSATQSVTNNTSTISWQLKCETAQSGWVRISELRLKFDGEQIFYRSHSVHTDAYNGTVLASGTKTITHNNDGSKAFTASIEAGIYQWAINRSGSGTITLDTIPRASSVACSTVAIGANPTINIARASSNFTHTLTYVFGSLSGTIAEKTTATSITNWTIPTSFYAEIPNAQYGTGTIYCDTYNGSTKIGSSSCSFRANVTNSSPGINPTMKDVDAATLALTGNDSYIVRYFSDVQYDVGATAKNGATIKSYKVSMGPQEATTATGKFVNVETENMTIYVTDSRGFVAKYSMKKTLIPYIKLTCDIWKINANADGEISVGISGNYFNGSFGAQSNTLTIQYRYKTIGEWSEWTTIECSPGSNKYELELNLTDMDYTQTYTFQARAIDKLATIQSVELPVRCIPVYDWSNDDFNLNVKLNMNSKTVLRHNTNANNTVLSGTGGFIYLRPGGTDITYNEVKINPQGAIELSGDIIINGQSLKSLLGIN